METYTIVLERVQHVGMLGAETIAIGDVLLGPMPPYQTGMSSETGAIVQVTAGSPEEAEKRAALSLENAITVLTYALCCQALLELHSELDVAVEIRQDRGEDNSVRTWRRRLQGVAEGSSETGSDRVHVIRSYAFRTLPLRVHGNLARFISDPPTQRLAQILNGHTTSDSNQVSVQYAQSLASAAGYLRRSMESEGPHAFLDAISGLEALFTPRDASPFYPVGAMVGYGVVYTSAVRDEPSTRLATWKHVKKLYNERSRLLHGDRLSIEVPHAASKVETMLVEGIEFCLVHRSTILACGGIADWLDMARFGCPEALATDESSPL